MRALRMTLAGVATVALVAGSVGVAIGQAQAGDDPMPADPSTGVIGFTDIGTDNAIHQVTEDGVSPLDFTVYNRGKTWQVEMDDRRLSGRLETNRTLKRYDSGVYVGTGIGRLTNEGGSWDVALHSLFDPVTAGRIVLYLTGADGYEGLHAVLLMHQAGEVDGVIVPGPLPEPPESLLPADD